MALFGGGKSKLFAAVDIGTHSIKALVFEVRKNGLPKVIRKMEGKLPIYFDPVKTVAVLHETMFAMVKNLERVPGKIMVSLGPSLAGHALESWQMRLGDGAKSLSRKDLRSYFQNLMDQRGEEGKTSFAYPLATYVNGYPLRPVAGVETEAAHVVLKNDAALVVQGKEELSFLSLVLGLPGDIGTVLSDVKKSFGGMPIEFVPLVLAEREALVRALGIYDAFLVDVGAEDTALMLMRGGDCIRVASFPVGVHQFLRNLADKKGLSLAEAESELRQYAQGLGNEKKRGDLKDFFTAEMKDWEEEFFRTSQLFYPLGPIPPLVFLAGGGGRLPEIAESLRNTAWLKTLSWADAPSVRFFTGESVFAGDTLDGSVQGPEEAGIASLVYYTINHDPFF